MDLENSWGKTWWPILVFTFFIACTEVIVYLAIKYFLKTDEIFMKFRGEMAKVLIKNSYISDDSCTSSVNTRKRKIPHILQTVPTHATEYDERMGLRRKF